MTTQLPTDLVQALTALGFTHDSVGKPSETLRNMHFTVRREDHLITVDCFTRDWWNVKFNQAPTDMIVRYLGTFKN